MTEPIISKYLDFKKTCRGCMLAVECEYILLACNVANKATSIVEQFMSCTSLLVEEEDGLPGILCKKCSTRVEDAFSFRLQCINSDAMLRTYLKIKSSEVYILQYHIVICFLVYICVQLKFLISILYKIITLAKLICNE